MRSILMISVVLLTISSCKTKQPVSRNRADVEIETNQFLLDKVKEEGIYKTESGLLYKVLEMGVGFMPLLGSKVKVHYTGKLVNGFVFDSSIERGMPAEFSLDQLIEGWQEGLLLMPEGSKFEFYIPSYLGYGKAGSPPSIGPNEALVFYVEMIQVMD